MAGEKFASELEKKLYFTEAETNYFVNKGKPGEQIPVIYEDNHIVAVIKPQGLLSQSDISGDDDVLSLIKEDIAVKANKPGAAFAGLVHRLDRNTGGTMVFAKTSKGASRLSEQLRAKKFYKGYFAIAEGILDTNGGRLIFDTLEKNEAENTVVRSKNGKVCELYIETVSKGKNETLVFAVPITGRTHQIRAQLSLLGYPLKGDVKYGGTAAFNERGERTLGLWSSVVAVKHPTKEEMCVFASIPAQEDVWRLFPINVYKSFAERITGNEFKRFISIKGNGDSK